MSKRDYYDVLGVDRAADEQDIKKAYRRIAMKYHPDRNPDDADADSKFKEATEAYEILSDSDKRGSYDQVGHAGVDPSMGGGGFQGRVLPDACAASVPALVSAEKKGARDAEGTCSG